MADTRKHRGIKVALGIIFVAIVALLISFFVYVNDFYHADDRAIEALEDMGAYAEDNVSVEQVAGKIAFVPTSPKAGFVFYPGGKVEASAYAPLMQELAADGILCVICPMPFNLAVFDINAADGVKDLFPDVTTWYIGGHSLGGSMAASYVDGHSGEYAGLVLLASYSTVDLGDTEECVISLYGTEDRVLNMSKYEEYAHNIQGVETFVINGGNHGQFGSYGQQDGDGSATIGPEAQWDIAARTIAEWMTRGD